MKGITPLPPLIRGAFVNLKISWLFPLWKRGMEGDLIINLPTPLFS